MDTFSGHFVNTRFILTCFLNIIQASERRLVWQGFSNLGGNGHPDFLLYKIWTSCLCWFCEPWEKTFEVLQAQSISAVSWAEKKTGVNQANPLPEEQEWH